MSAILEDELFFGENIPAPAFLQNLVRNWSFNILKFGVNPFLEFMAAIVTNTFIVGVIHSPWKSAALIFILMTTRSDILSKQFRHTAVLSRVLKLIKHSIQSFIFLSYCL